MVSVVLFNITKDFLHLIFWLENKLLYLLVLLDDDEVIGDGEDAVDLAEINEVLLDLGVEIHAWGDGLLTLTDYGAAQHAALEWG